MTAPRLMNHPLWLGKIKGRIAKKYLPSTMRNQSLVSAMAKISSGDLIRNCSAFNVRVSLIEPTYRRIGQQGQVLVDLDITTNCGLCSFVHCGVDPAWSRDSILRDWETRIAYYRSIGDQWNFAKRYEFTTVDERGQAIFDYDAYTHKYGDPFAYVS